MSSLQFDHVHFRQLVVDFVKFKSLFVFVFKLFYTFGLSFVEFKRVVVWGFAWVNKSAVIRGGGGMN